MEPFLVGCVVIHVTEDMAGTVIENDFVDTKKPTVEVGNHHKGLAREEERNRAGIAYCIDSAAMSKTNNTAVV